MNWLELLGPVLAVLSGLPPLTLAYLLWRRQPTPILGVFVRGLAVLSLAAILTAVGIFLISSGLLVGRASLFVLWNAVFVLALVGLQWFRVFVRRLMAVPGPAGRHWLSWVIAALGYAASFAAGFFLAGDWALWFSISFYLVGLTRPSLRLVRAFDRLPGWFQGLLVNFGRILAPVATLVLAWEAGLRLGLIPSLWPSLIPFLLVVFFILVTVALLHELLADLSRASQPPIDPEVRRSAELVASLCRATPLSDRELEVLTCLLRGLTNRQIATELKISDSTVKNHVYNLFQKIGLGSRQELRDRVAEFRRESSLVAN